MRAAEYEILVLDPKNPRGFQERLPEKCVLLNLSGTYYRDKGKLGGKISEVVTYDKSRHDAIMKALVKRGNHVLVHGFYQGEKDNETHTKIFRELAKNGITFSHLITKSHLQELRESDDPKLNELAEMLDKDGFLPFQL